MELDQCSTTSTLIYGVRILTQRSIRAQGDDDSDPGMLRCLIKFCPGDALGYDIG